ncbi:hypothetical protein DB41_JE00030 [Neochlamydia sp. TUME1]|nr:hypothetical protein DB41_JE00030 [Neochlamydia sp. TUME1]
MEAYWEIWRIEDLSKKEEKNVGGKKRRAAAAIVDSQSVKITD